MNKIDLLYGFLIGVAASLLGSYLFILFFTEYPFVEGITAIRAQGSLGKLLTLGAILNIVAFFILLKYKRELMARGVVFATIVMAILTLFL